MVNYMEDRRVIFGVVVSFYMLCFVVTYHLNMIIQRNYMKWSSMKIMRNQKTYHL